MFENVLVWLLLLLIATVVFLVLRRKKAAGTFFFLVVLGLLVLREITFGFHARSLVWENRTNLEFCNGVREFYSYSQNSSVMLYVGVVILAFLFLWKRKKQE